MNYYTDDTFFDCILEAESEKSFELILNAFFNEADYFITIEDMTRG